MITWQKYRAMDRRRQILYAVIAILILLLLILGIFWVFTVSRSNRQAPVNNAPATITPITNSSSQIMNTIDQQSLAQQKAVENAEKPVRLVAEPFVERFGSYNNQGDLSNFSDLNFYETATFRSWVNTTYIPQLQKTLPDSSTYFAVNTKAVTSTINSIDEKTGKAELVINTQRQEVGAGNVQIRVYYQEAKVQLVREGTEWKVDALYWL